VFQTINFSRIDPVYLQFNAKKWIFFHAWTLPSDQNVDSEVCENAKHITHDEIKNNFLLILPVGAGYSIAG